MKITKEEVKNTLKRTLKRWGIMTLIILFLIGTCLPWDTKSQIMKSLDYDITLNEDGSATIVETWEIYLINTNTIVRTFERSDKFGDITNVKVKDLDNNRDLTQIYNEMNHVITNCFYALDVLNGDDNKFEVAWGTGMQNSSGTKRYEFTYTVTDVITDYKDCQEFYWKLLAQSNAIPVSKVT